MMNSSIDGRENYYLLERNKREKCNSVQLFLEVNQVKDKKKTLSESHESLL